MPYLALLAVTGVVPAVAQNRGQGRGPIQSSSRHGDYRHRKNSGEPIRIGNTQIMINPRRITTGSRFDKTSLFKTTESLAGRSLLVTGCRDTRHPGHLLAQKKPRPDTVVN